MRVAPCRQPCALGHLPTLPLTPNLALHDHSCTNLSQYDQQLVFLRQICLEVVVLRQIWVLTTHLVHGRT
jgi:hypothetical protein